MYRLTNDREVLLHRLDVAKAVFVERVNRFLCVANAGDVRVKLRLTNTGRLKEVLKAESVVLYRKNSTARSDGVLVGVVVGDAAAIIDTYEQARAFEEAFRRGLIPWLYRFTAFKREVMFEGSRFDYLFTSATERAITELKSAVYLREDGAAMYPDTVSLRGRIHLMKLMKLVEKVSAYIVFVAAHPSARFFTPCDEGDPMIRKLLMVAHEKGVVVKAVKTFLTLDGWVVWVNSDLPVSLD